MRNIIVFVVMFLSAPQIAESVNSTTDFFHQWLQSFCDIEVASKCDCSTRELEFKNFGLYNEYKCVFSLYGNITRMYIVTANAIGMKSQKKTYSLDLECQKVSQLNVSIFKKFESLEVKFLTIKKCPIPSNSFQYDSNLRGLQLIDAKLPNSIDVNYSLNNLYSLKLKSNEYQELQVDLLFNRIIPELHDLVLVNYNIKLSENGWWMFPTLKFLTFRSSFQSGISPYIFQNLNTLTSLEIVENNFTFNEYPSMKIPNLGVLNLAKNQITYLKKDSLNNFTNLTYIDVSNNNLEHLPRTLFRKNKQLRNINLSFNSIVYIPESIFLNLIDLEILVLTNMNLRQIYKSTFKTLENLKILNLSCNSITYLSPELFRPLITLYLLDLSNNKLSTFSVGEDLENLNTLILEYNSIMFFSFSNSGYPKLETLKLAHNNIVTITFSNCYSLKSIDLSYNKILSYLYCSDIFKHCYSLEDINFSFNRLSQAYPLNSISRQHSLQQINYTNNRILNISIKDFYSLHQKINRKTILDFSFNNITKIDLKNQTEKQANSIVSKLILYNNPIKCGCSNYNLLQYANESKLRDNVKDLFEIVLNNLTCTEPSTNKLKLITNVQLETIPCTLSELNMTVKCPEKCDCYGRPFDATFVLNCTNRNLNKYPQLDFIFDKTLQNIALHLENNSLATGPSKNEDNYWNLTGLYLTGNRINNLTWIPPKLKVLFLDHNRLEKLDLTLFNASQVQQLSLNDNPWSCDCGVEDFAQYLRDHPVIGDVWCASSPETKIVSLHKNDVCPNWIIPVTISLLALLSTALVFVALALYYRKQLKMWLYAHDFCLWWVKEEDIDKHKIYDAFISYSYKDEQFFIDNLLPGLEDIPNPYKLCLHLRHWIPGEFIPKQILQSVIDSKRTVILLSDNFVESYWGQVEFRTAHMQALKEGRARVIVVVVGKLTVKKMDNELKSYLSTYTYLEWGDPFFWSKLRYALPHRSPGSSNQPQCQTRTETTQV